jgi:hypothetical protein
MNYYIQFIADWSEVWAMLFPLGMLLIRPKQPTTLKPVILYLWLGFIINLMIDIIMVYKSYLPDWLQSNNPFYNVHSVIRFIFFSLYFIRLPQPAFAILKKMLPFLYVLFLIINFGFFENFFNPESLSGNLLSAEAYLLLVYCMLYYLSELQDDSKNLFSGPDFWVVTGLSIYVVINFFVFLFYLPMLDVNIDLAINIWNVHNIAFIIFCLFLTKAFYGPLRYQYSV